MFSLPCDGTVDALRKTIKERWMQLEQHFPSISDKPFSFSGVTMASQTEGRGEISEPTASVPLSSRVLHSVGDIGEVPTRDSLKLKEKALTELLKSVPIIMSMEPQVVLNFLVQVTDIFDLHLVSDYHFLICVLTRNVGRITQIISSRLNTVETSWLLVRNDIVSVVFPSRVRESFVNDRVLNRFHLPSDNLFEFVTRVRAEALILQVSLSETELVHRIMQNLHLSVCASVPFSSLPSTFVQLEFITQVNEVSAVQAARALSQVERHCPVRNAGQKQWVT